MLSNREIHERFEVQINTLYNWHKTKPKLYKYLQNADFNFERGKEINILFEEYSKEIKGTFTLEEIEYLVLANLEFVTIEEIKIFEKLFIELQYKKIPDNRDVILSIYNKILVMSVIDKYVLYKRIYNFRKEKHLSNELEFFFKEFLV